MNATRKSPLILRRLAVGAVVIVQLALLSGCSKNPDASETKPQYSVHVKVASVVRSDIKSTIREVGTVEALNRAKISAKIPGKIEKILADSGDRVEAGQTLLCLEKTDLILNIRRAEAAVAVAEANFSKAKAEWARMQELSEQGIASQQQYDLAMSVFDIAEASVKQAKADSGLVQNRLDNADVTTLFGGVVIRRYADLGERVSPGQPLIEVAQLNPVEVEVGVSDRRFSQVKLGQLAAIRVDGYPKLVFTGEVKKIQPSIDVATRTFKVTIGVDNPEELLKPGMLARVEIEISHHSDVLVIPKAALLEEEGAYLTVVVRDGRARRVEIALGFRDRDRVEVLSGLSEGEQVVLEGAYALAEGAFVQVSGE